MILLIALLPVRGWTAGLMAVAMSTPQGAVSAVATASPQAQMPPDCPMVGKAKAGADFDDGKGCNACQLCMELAVLETPSVAPPAAIMIARTAWCVDRFASADSPRVAEPPIF